MDNYSDHSETVTIPAALVGGGESEGMQVGETVTVTLRGKLLSTGDGKATIQLENATETEAPEPMSERDRVRGMGEAADMEED